MKKIIQITAGKGPEECSFVVAQVLKIFLDEALQAGLNPIVIHREAGNINGTVLSATVMVDGKDSPEFVKSWKGTILWIGFTKSKLQKNKSWFIRIFELNSFKPAELNEKDFEFQAMRSSGAGGQNVNKVNTAIRATHKPTGIAVVAMDSRSQHQNKKLATQRLLEKLNEENLKSFQNKIQNEMKSPIEWEKSKPIRIFKGSDFKKQKTEKNFKSERQKLKRDLGKNFDD